jgi:DNA/RNA endonuclease YhcR with UshA esterase domain
MRLTSRGSLAFSTFAMVLCLWLGGLPGKVQAVTPEEALQLDGKNGTIEGIVSDVNITERGHAFINMGGVYPNHTFTAYVPAVIVPIFGKEYLESLRGKDIAVTGKIKIYKGKPEIVYNKKDQVVVKGGEPEKKEIAK